MYKLDSHEDFCQSALVEMAPCWKTTKPCQKFFEQVDGVPLMLSLSESYIGTGLDSAWILNLSEVFAKLQGRARLSYHGFSDQGRVNVLG
jgi:hypothetical protein